MHKDITLKISPSQRRGVMINRKINLKILTTLKAGVKFKESMVDFKKSWLTVSQKLVKAIKERIINNFSFILPV